MSLIFRNHHLGDSGAVALKIAPPVGEAIKKEAERREAKGHRRAEPRFPAHPRLGAWEFLQKPEVPFKRVPLNPWGTIPMLLFLAH